MKLQSLFCLGLVQVFFAATAQADPERLSVADVIQKVLDKSFDRNLIDQTYQSTESLVYSAWSPFSTEFNANYGYEMTRLLTLSNISNPEDQNTTMGAGVTKKMPTGTSLGVQYSRTIQQSVLSSFTGSLRPPNQTQDLVSFNLRQRLLNNAFGFQDRSKIQVANLSRSRSHLERSESLEKIVMDSIRAYWDAYAAKENLKESVFAREKYQTLVDYFKKKSRQGFTNRGEVPRAIAELNDQERAVKTASLNYINSVERLYLLMNQKEPGEVDFVVSDLLPQAPVDTQTVEVGSLRKMRAQAILVQAAEEERSVAMKADWPSLDFVSKLAANGVQKTSDRSFSEMVNGRHPNYFVGLEFVYAFDSDLVRAERVAKQVQYQTALIQLDKLKAELWDTSERTARNVRAKYLVAKTAIETVGSWERVISEQEKNLRLGRITTFELIQDYGSYFRARSSKNIAVADYHVSLQEYLEARDKLVKEGS